MNSTNSTIYTLLHTGGVCSQKFTVMSDEFAGGERYGMIALPANLPQAIITLNCKLAEGNQNFAKAVVRLTFAAQK